jgi:adenine-specific DNA-methyltransferase
MTPSSLASFMAALLGPTPKDVRLLEAGAGVGSLLAACVAELCDRSVTPNRISVTAYELDSALATYLRATADECETECARANVRFDAQVIQGDFIDAAVEQLEGGLFAPQSRERYTHAILNPPYKKLTSDSPARASLRRVGIETSNLYTAFLGLAILLLEPGGELVAITPRSFCNGPYFRPFRQLFLEHMSLRQVHVFDSRSSAFEDDEVLQENVVLHAIKGAPPETVLVTSSDGPDSILVSARSVPFREVVHPREREQFIRLVPEEAGDRITEAFRRLPAQLGDLGLFVSTGRVVDFRAREHLRAEPEKGAAPLIHPTHFSDGAVRWPKSGKKPNALAETPETEELLMPSGTYVLVKRFSAKEERRRVVAAMFDPALVPGSRIGFENHLNVFHAKGTGFRPDVARGLSLFLNSTLVDAYFRQFNGHTQVNATDLRNLRYPSKETLVDLARAASRGHLAQEDLDRVVEDVLAFESGEIQMTVRKVEEALAVLQELGLPKAQQNERSALTLLAFLDMKASTPWAQASTPLMGITPIMEFIFGRYQKKYAPNTRETIRRQTVHQFLEAGLIVANPDEPRRPVNSPKAVYQIEAKALVVLRAYGSKEWPKQLAIYREDTHYAPACAFSNA